MQDVVSIHQNHGARFYATVGKDELAPESNLFPLPGDLFLHPVDQFIDGKRRPFVSKPANPGLILKSGKKLDLYSRHWGYSDIKAF
jgi:hypothetical protein